MFERKEKTIKEKHGKTCYMTKPFHHIKIEVLKGLKRKKK